MSLCLPIFVCGGVASGNNPFTPSEVAEIEQLSKDKPLRIDDPNVLEYVFKGIYSGITKEKPDEQIKSVFLTSNGIYASKDIKKTESAKDKILDNSNEAFDIALSEDNVLKVLSKADNFYLSMLETDPKKEALFLEIFRKAIAKADEEFGKDSWYARCNVGLQENKAFSFEFQKGFPEGMERSFDFFEEFLGLPPKFMNKDGRTIDEFVSSVATKASQKHPDTSRMKSKLDFMIEIAEQMQKDADFGKKGFSIDRKYKIIEAQIDNVIKGKFSTDMKISHIFLSPKSAKASLSLKEFKLRFMYHWRFFFDGKFDMSNEAFSYNIPTFKSLSLLFQIYFTHISNRFWQLFGY